MIPKPATGWTIFRVAGRIFVVHQSLSAGADRPEQSENKTGYVDLAGFLRFLALLGHVCRRPEKEVRKISRKHGERRKTIQQWTFWAFFYLLPGGFLPLKDLVLISLSGAQGPALQTPPQLVQEFPYMIRVIADSRELLDQCRHARQRPKIAFEAMRGCSAKELALN